MKDLVSKQFYFVKVQAVSITGVSPESTVSDPIETLLLPPGKPHASKVTHNSLHLKWSRPESNSDCVQSYTVFYHSIDESVDLWHETKTSSPTESIVLNGLTPNTYYCFKIRAETPTWPSSESNESDTVRTGLPSPGKPRACSVCHNSVELSWKKPSRGAEHVQDYTVQYRTKDGSWASKRTNKAVESLKVGNLLPGTLHYFIVRANTAAGPSQDSDI